MSARAEVRQARADLQHQAVEQLLAATDTAVRAGLPVPCLGSFANPDAWLSEDETVRADAAQACGACPVIAECLTYADAHRTTFGVYGGRDFTVSQRSKGVARV